MPDRLAARPQRDNAWKLEHSPRAEIQHEQRSIEHRKRPVHT